MRRRILQSILGVVILTALLLGAPLIYTAWLWVEDVSRSDLRVRLDRMATEVIAQEGASGVVDGTLDTDALRLLTPRGGRLVIVYPTVSDGASRVDLGESAVKNPLVESLAMGSSGSLRLEVPSEKVRTQQKQAVAAVGILVLLAMTTGAVVAVVTARRLADPLQDVADRAARLAEGDFRPDPRRHAIPELDRVSDVLDAATVEIAGQLQRERALVGDVSHQLRSRLTAVRLRLDELSVHEDPDVVNEAEEAMAQVDRLTDGIDELVRSSRSSSSATKSVSVVGELESVTRDWRPQFEDDGRKLRLNGDRGVLASTTGSRLREAVSVLVDNAYEHGGGNAAVSVRLIAGAGQREPMVCVEVTDEGEGVDNNLAPHIFDRGFSGAGSTGVGLALARALIEMDGGRLELQRRKPALFAVFLPVATGRGQERPPDVSVLREPR
ncbi:HAMP domain-containing sensor histidine kinase [Rhodococcus sp. ARC_M6]|uniref:sensor histidine kinase n=1 Tax=Rhodococcus sp. ARC_M6 TaxID=2928852 RepID=UPI001FB29826|nr:HAMP domain-containing sensor histidine kinase [Rhodococcus sp. ARC_M6]MCJ0903598.1 HAMP domain-containing histidine kinase [Rhodococcus sp. ARC_M6]